MKDEAVQRGHESYDLGARPLLAAGLGVAGLVALALGVTALVFAMLERRAERADVLPHALAGEPEEPPEPRLLADPDRHYLDYLREQRARLEGYDWVDRERGIVRIPLERAAELIAAEGLPVR